MGASATQETRKKDPTSLILSRGVESLLRPSHFKETDGAQPSVLDAMRKVRAAPNFSHDFSRIPTQNTPVQFQAKLAINQPGDEYEQEADRIAEEVVNGSAAGISTWKAPGTTVMRQAAGKSGSEKEEEKYKDAAKKTGEAFLETDLGKKLTEQAKEKGEEFITSIPGMVITGVAAAGAVGYLAATNKELPIGLPEIPLDKLHPGLKMKITYEGPVLSPTKAMIMFSGTFGGPKEEKKPGMTKTEMEKAKTAKMAAEMAAFQEMLKTPEQKKAEEEALTKFTAEKFGPKLPGTKAGAPAMPFLTLTPPTLEYKKKSYKLLEEELKLDVPGIEIKPEEETEKKKKDEEKPLQRKAQSTAKDSSAAADVPPIVHEVLHSPRQPLDGRAKAFLESRIGYDFSHVCVHTDALANSSAQSLHASAYTVGKDIIFASGAYAPSSVKGMRLLAHELAHVIQQDGNGKRIQRWGDTIHKEVTEKASDVIADDDVVPVAARKTDFVEKLKPYSFSTDYKARRILWTGPLFFSGAAEGEGPDHGEDGNYSKCEKDRESARAENVKRQQQYIDESVRYYQQFISSLRRGERREQGGPAIGRSDIGDVGALPVLGAVGGAIGGTLYGYGAARWVGKKVGGGFWGSVLGALTGLVTVPLGLVFGTVAGALGVGAAVAAGKSRPAMNARDGVLAALGDACHVAQDRASHWEGVRGKGHTDPKTKIQGWDPDNKDDNRGDEPEDFGGYKIAIQNTREVFKTWIARILAKRLLTPLD